MKGAFYRHRGLIRPVSVLDNSCGFCLSADKRVSPQCTMHLMTVGDVVLWDAESLLADADLYGYEHITDVFRTRSAPPPRSIAVAIGDSGDRVALDAAEGPWVIGLAVVQPSSRRGVAQGKVGKRFEPWTNVRPMPLKTALDGALGQQAAEVEWPGPMMVTSLTPARGKLLLSFLADQDDTVAQWLDDVAIPAPDREDPQLQSRLEARDAVGLAGLLANVDIPGSGIRRRIDTDAVNLLQSVFANVKVPDLEEDLLPEDLRRFDGFTEPEMYSASIAVFRTGDVELAVFNVNKKAFEVALGVDLIYWDTTHDVFTLVQYKRLEQTDGSAGRAGPWAYHRRDEIVDQLSLMPQLVNKPTTSRDWRMTQSPFWFKFVRGDAATIQDAHLLRGMYLPADYLRLAIDDGSLMTGPRGGFRIDYDNVRYLDRGAFVRLVQQGLIGTASEQSADLHRVIEDLTASGRSVVLAVKSKWVAAAAAHSPEFRSCWSVE